MKRIIQVGRLIDGTGGPVKEEVDLLIEGNLIAGIQPRGTFHEPEAKIISAEAKSLLPGLIDAHVHICFARPWPKPKPWGVLDWANMAIQGARNARLILESGVTTIRTVGTSGDVDFALRDAISEGTIQGPRIVAAGEVICITGGHGYFIGIEADGADGMRRAVRSKVKSGADVIKLMVTGGVLTPRGVPGRPQMNRDELEVAIEEAHRADFKVCGHAEGIQGVNDAIAAGIDSIEHGNFMNNEEGLELMLEHGTFLVPTLMVQQLTAEGHGHFSGEALRNAQMGLEYNQTGFRRAVEVGAKIAMGSDLVEDLGLDHGHGWRELIYMVQNGMSPMQAIVAATKNAAELLGLESEIGSVEKGKRADVILIDGNPLEDISQIGNVVLVLKDGNAIGQNR